MLQTAQELENNLPELDVPIILTGAMTPLGFDRSDGLQNLTESLLAAKLLPPGVHWSYIALSSTSMKFGKMVIEQRSFMPMDSECK